MTTPTPQPGFAPAPVNSTQWNAQVVQDAAQAQQRATSDKRAQASQYDWIPDWVSKPVEFMGSVLHSAYTNVISRPLTTLFLSSYIGSDEAQGDTWYERMGSSWANQFNPDVWEHAWRDSAHVSPGQAFEFGLERMFTNTDVKSALEKPVIYKPKDMAGKPVVDATGKPVEINLNKQGILWDNPDAVHAHYDEGIQKWISGGLDAYISWYADPAVLAGKGLGMARNLAYVRPAITGEPRFGGLLAQKAGISTPAGQSLVDKNLNSSAFNTMGDLIMKNKEKLGQDAFPEWVTRQNWAKNSSDSGAIAAALGKAQDRYDVDQILSVAMGDQKALQNLTSRDAELSAQMNRLNERKNGLITGNPSTVSPEDAARLQLQLKTLSEDMSKIDTEKSIISGKLAAQDTMKNGMYFNPVLSPIASNFGQYARGLQTVGTGNPLTSPVRAGMALLYNNLYVRPIRVLSGTTWNGVRAPGHIDIDASDSYRALGASLDQAKVWSPDQVRSMVSSYITADRATKDFIVQQADQATVRAIAAKHGLSDGEADAIYRQLGGMKGRARDGRVYSTAYIETADGGRLRADHVADDGSLIAVSPVLNSQLQNTHILTDYEHMDRTLKLTAKPFQKLLREQEIRQREADQLGPLTSSEAAQAASDALSNLPSTLGARALKTLQVGKDMSDTMDKLWKFNVLLRLGYGPRAIADDFMGQVAALGAHNFFMERVAKGGRNMVVRNMNRITGDPTGYEQIAASIDSGIASLTEQAGRHQAKLDRINAYLPAGPEGGRSYAGAGAKGRRQFNQRTSELQKTQSQLDDVTQQINSLKAYRNKIGETKNSLGDNYVIMPDGTAFARPFEGPQGQMFKNLLSGRRTIDSMMGGTASQMWNQFRQGDWRTVTVADGEEYVGAYLRALQGQIANDAAARVVLSGQDLTKWFGTSAGRQYRRESAMKNMTDADHADRIESTVDNLLPATATPEQAKLRQLVSQGAPDKDVALAIRDAVSKHAKAGLLPDVQAEGIAYNMGKGDFASHVDSVIDKFYKVAGQLPSEVLSRNPLFFQLYRQHVSDLYEIAKQGGLEKLSPGRQQQMEESARKLALKDVKKLTFNMDYETKLAHAMRFVAPFWGPMQESFTRWGHIIADKPDVLAQASKIYTAPIRAGHAVDQNGNLVDEDGYVTNPDGTKTLVSKKDMHLQFQAPQWLAKSIGMDQGSIIDMPINTLNLVLQNDPWYNPGMGPWVQVPANYAALKSDPSFGDTLTKLGILQQVTPDVKGQILGAGPNLLSSILGGEDYKQQQKDMAYIMQAEDYKWKNGMRDKEPTWQEVKDRASNSALLRAWMKFSSPVSVGFKDPYQFFRDRYQELQKADPKTADQVFLAKYGSAAFSFTGALTYDRKHLPATVEAVMKDKQYSYLTDVDPDLAALVVNPSQAEPFSQTAYVQQMASGERKNLDAYDVMAKSQENLGWAQYNKYMNVLTAGLRQAGFNSFSDRGAEAYQERRQRLISILTEPQINGVQNKNYNEEFAKAFLTIDKSKDDRIANAMRKIVTESTLVNDPMRKDIQGLSQYMVYRDSVNAVLDARKRAGGSNDINANQNRDIKLQFSNAVDALREQNTMFESLHERWLVHDMFDHHNPNGSN